MPNDSLETRRAHAADLMALAEMWYDRMALAGQLQGSLGAPSSSDWLERARQTFQTDAEALLVVERERDLLGYTWAEVRDGQGYIRELVVDLHTRYLQQGAGRHLLRALARWFSAWGLHEVRLMLLPTLAVELAFWQGQGAVHRDGEWWVLL